MPCHPRRRRRGTPDARERSAAPEPSETDRWLVGSMSSWLVSNRLVTALTYQCEKSGQSAREKGENRQLFRQLPEKPGPAKRPESVGGTATNPQSCGRILVR